MDGWILRLVSTIWKGRRSSTAAKAQPPKKEGCRLGPLPPSETQPKELWGEFGRARDFFHVTQRHEY
jgi:hypothetical protein